MQSAFLKSIYAQGERPGFLLVGLLCLLLLASACNNARSDASISGTQANTSPPPQQRTTGQVPPVATPGSASTGQYGFTLLDNRRMKLSDYLGHVVVLDFYATWCPPCREETPHLVALQRRYGSQGLHVIGLNVGGAEDRNKVPEYVEEFKIQYTLGFPDPQLTNLYLSDDDRIPQAFIFDRKGRLLKRFISYDNTMPAEMERIVRTALETGE